MFKVTKQGDTYRLLYSAKNFTTGLSDVQAVPYNPSGSAQTPVSMTEIGSTGVYYADFDTTSLTLGVWSFKIDSATKSSAAIDKIQIVDPDTLNDTVLEKLDTMLDTALTDLTTIDGKVDTIDTVVDGIQTDLDNGTDGLGAIKSAIDTVQSSVSGLSNNADAKIALVSAMLIPGSGSSTYKFFFRFYDSEGNMEDPDDQDAGAEQAMVNVTVENSAGTDRSGNLTGLSASTQDSKDWMTRESQGVFSAIYTVASTHAVEDLIFGFDILEGSNAKSFAAISRAASSSDDYTSRFDTIDSNIAIIDTVVDGIQSDLDNGTDGLGALKTLIDAIQADLDNGTDGLGAIKTAVDGNNTLLTSATYGLAALKTLIDTIDGNVDTAVADLSDIKGTGWSSGEDLHNIYEQTAPGGIAI